MKMDDLFQIELYQLEDELDQQIPTWPNRPGDANPDTIFARVGHALTRWERVEVSLLETLRALQTTLENSNKIARNYSRRRDAQQKVALIVSEFRKQAQSQSIVSGAEEVFAKELRTYLKWKTARNRLAHGVVIAAGPVMMEEVENGLIQTYQLHPSEADHRAWMLPWQHVVNSEGAFLREGNDDDLYINDGPTYSYMAKDIQLISGQILQLDLRLRKLTELFVGEKLDFDDLIDFTNDDEGDLSI